MAMFFDDFFCAFRWIVNYLLKHLEEKYHQLDTPNFQISQAHKNIPCPSLVTIPFPEAKADPWLIWLSVFELPQSGADGEGFALGTTEPRGE